jgi:hypothetical protein
VDVTLIKRAAIVPEDCNDQVLDYTNDEAIKRFETGEMKTRRTAWFQEDNVTVFKLGEAFFKGTQA